MEWQGYTTAGWAELLRGVAALEKQYGVRISWKEKFGTLRLHPQVGFSAEREIPLAEFYGAGAVAAQPTASTAHPASSLAEEGEADLRTLCAAIEAASINTCQVCGVQGEVRQFRMPDDRWVMSLCEECALSRTHFVVQRCAGRGHPRAPYVVGMLHDMCDRHRQDLQCLLPLLAEDESQTAALGHILAKISIPSFAGVTSKDVTSHLVDTEACKHLLQKYVAWLKTVGSAVQTLPCGKVEKGEKI